MTPYSHLTFQIRVEGKSPEVAVDPASVGVLLGCSGNKNDSATVPVERYAKGFADGKWHKVEIPISAFTKGPGRQVRPAVVLGVSARHLERGAAALRHLHRRHRAREAVGHRRGGNAEGARRGGREHLGGGGRRLRRQHPPRGRGRRPPAGRGTARHLPGDAARRGVHRRGDPLRDARAHRPVRLEERGHQGRWFRQRHRDEPGAAGPRLRAHRRGGGLPFRSGERALGADHRLGRQTQFEPHRDREHRHGSRRSEPRLPGRGRVHQHQRIHPQLDRHGADLDPEQHRGADGRQRRRPQHGRAAGRRPQFAEHPLLRFAHHGALDQRRLRPDLDAGGELHERPRRQRRVRGGDDHGKRLRADVRAVRSFDRHRGERHAHDLRRCRRDVRAGALPLDRRRRDLAAGRRTAAGDDAAPRGARRLRRRLLRVQQRVGSERRHRRRGLALHAGDRRLDRRQPRARWVRFRRNLSRRRSPRDARRHDDR